MESLSNESFDFGIDQVENYIYNHLKSEQITRSI